MAHLTLRGSLLTVALLTASAGFAGAQTAGQDMKDAGHDTAHATKKVYHKTKRGTKKAYHKTADGTKTVTHKTVDGTKDVGHDVAHGTKVGVEKTGNGLSKLGDKMSGKPNN